ncbi:MAG: serine/threonine-protein kinase, partial [Rhodothermales bacterium]|nr:serine/threonine-protein kinase [Rhodothermales bacterium]
MPRPDWKDIESLFEAALDHPEHERLTWLKEACPDPDLYQEVEAMLRAANRAEDFLSRPASEIASTLIVDSHRNGRRGDEPADDVHPEGKIGRYRIVRRIGWGGAGAVFLGERADGEFRQRVAIKLLREDRMSRSQQRRFLAERQILASLNHPGIARLLDGGVTEQGIPFIVMEYIDGQPIDEYCDDRRLSVRERLELFRKVCTAVQYAHGQLVVHRDIKPSNVMVTGEGDVKLVDFGIAKLLDAEHDLPGTGRPTLNLTPEYASPEQVRGEAITAVSDVYSLGVLLYQLLTGRRPYEMAGASAARIVKTVCETEPDTPSDAVRTVPAVNDEDEVVSPEEVATRRRVGLEALCRQLRGDIDTIILKALRKEASRRYQSVESFADDIRRFLTSRPVRARRDTLVYRVSKYVRRNRIVVAAVALVTLSLVGGFAISLWQASERAEQATRAERTTRFMKDMLAGFDPNTRPNELQHVEEILDMGAQRLHQDLAGEPALSAEIAVVLADLYEDYGVYEKARDLYELSIAQQRATGRRDARLAEVTAKLGSVANKMGNHHQARELMLSALEISEAVHGPNSMEAADVLDGLAIVHINTGQLDRARELLSQALEIFKSVYGDDHVRVAGVHR